ncbi:hypothetical protein JST97_28155 [bacterium]|nr:hypothetical protein [bacterium]
MSSYFKTFAVALLGGFVGASLRLPPAQADASDALWIKGPDGRDRIQIATYTAASERGLPLVGLFDNRSQLRLLLRLAGPNESPVMVLKDPRGRDRLVLGLGLNGSGDPFCSITDSQGRKTDVFGHY